MEGDLLSLDLLGSGVLARRVVEDVLRHLRQRHHDLLLLLPRVAARTAIELDRALATLLVLDLHIQLRVVAPG
jgi:hypothetical protein